MTHICVDNTCITIIRSDNGLSPGRRQAIIWTNAGILLIRPLGTNFSQILSEIQTFSFKKIHLKMSSGKCRPFCLGPNVLTTNNKITVISMSYFHNQKYCKISNGPIWGQSLCYMDRRYIFLILCIGKLVETLHFFLTAYFWMFCFVNVFGW